MTEEPHDELHAEMWRHYDSLRQDKNKTFLAANTVLAAVLGVAWRIEPTRPQLILILLPLLGFVVCVLWFLILERNTAYIEFHRSRVSLWKDEWEAFRRELRLSQSLSSTLMDRLLATSFGVFYLAVFGCLVLRGC